MAVEEKKEKPKISKKDFFLMLAVAVFFDIVLALIQLIPVAGSVMASVFGVIPFMGFFIWYQLLGLDFKNPKKAFTFFGCSILEFIPVINALPAWTCEVVVMYIMQKKDIILEKAAGAVGKAGGITSTLSTGAKMVGAKNLAKDLGEASKELKSTEKDIRNEITPNRKTNTSNRVSDGITQQNQVDKKNINNKEKPAEKEPDNILQFENARPYNKDQATERNVA